jgi:preprotein translocase subunit SecB
VAGSQTSESPLVIECTFDAHFHVEAHMAEGFAKQFTESDMRLVLWPYFRQYVFDTTARMAIPPVLVPLSTESLE